MCLIENLLVIFYKRLKHRSVSIFLSNSFLLQIESGNRKHLSKHASVESISNLLHRIFSIRPKFIRFIYKSTKETSEVVDCATTIDSNSW